MSGHTWIAFAIFTLFMGIDWRERGGAFTQATGINPGTDGARLGCGVLSAGVLYLASHQWQAGLLAVSELVGLMLTGWGPFQGMGLEKGQIPERSWLRWLPLAVGFARETIPHDMLGLAQAGIVCVAPSAVICAWVAHWGWRAPVAVLAAGALFPLAYLIARIGLPRVPDFAKGQAWGEVGAGMLFGAGLGYVFILT